MAQYYGVWEGRKPGVYDNWNDCKNQVDKFAGAKFRKLKSKDYNEALLEFDQENANNVKQDLTSNIKNESGSQNKSQVIENEKKDILTVDGAYNGTHCEFRAVWYPSNIEAFASPKYNEGTNNIAEFLGLVGALKYLMEKDLPLDIYSDSVTAIAWVRNKKANTTANNTGKATQEINTLIKNAEKFLIENATFLNKANIMKWDTANRGEIAADYGRKGKSVRFNR